jgi:adhesin transport system membrane fusion protein
MKPVVQLKSTQPDQATQPVTRLKMPSANTGRLIVVAFGAVVSFFVWSAYASLDKITRGSGQVIASSHTQVVQAADGGVITTLNVREGSLVKHHQLLATLDSIKAEAGVKETAARAAGLAANIARLKAEVFGGTPQFAADLQKSYPGFVSDQKTLFIKRKAAVNEEVSALESALALVKQELNMNLPLLQTGDVSRADVLRLQRQVADLTGQIANIKNKFLQDSQAELSKDEEDLAGVNQILAQRQDQLSDTRLYAPVDGIVRNVQATTMGAVLKPGEELLSIVPVDDKLIVEAKVKPADIAYMKLGLPATVKFDAWDYSIYGSFHGKVTYISADTLTEEGPRNDQPYYRVNIELPNHLKSIKGTDIDLQPGMIAQVEIKTGTQTVFQYLFKPIIKTLSESMGER